MNSASARASSVLPTPVGPRKRKVPIGRSGSCRPARERRRALETAMTASSWPITRRCRRSSMWTSFSTSPSSMRDDRDARPLGHHLGDLVGVDPLGQVDGRLELVVGALLGLGEPALELGDLAVAQLGGALVVELALGALQLDARGVEPLAQLAVALGLLLLALPLGAHPGRLLAQLGQLALDLPRAARRPCRPWPPPRARSRAGGSGARPGRSRWARRRARWRRARPPRRRGRSPCRAGSGRRCSGARASPPRSAPRR